MNGDELKEAAVEYQPIPPDSPYAELAEELFRERVERARQMPAEEKILAGQQLFEAACEITLLGIRDQFPGRDEAFYREVLRKRLDERKKRQAAQ